MVSMKKILHILIFYWFPPVLFAMFMFFLSTRPDLRSGLPDSMDLVLRKFAHISEYFVLTILLARVGTRGRSDMRTRIFAVIFASLGAFMVACFDETIQGYIPGRVASLRDVGIDSVGIILAAAVLLCKAMFRETIPEKAKRAL